MPGDVVLQYRHGQWLGECQQRELFQLLGGGQQVTFEGMTQKGNAIIVDA